MSDLVFIDVETTGFSPRRHEIIDIWARRVRADTLELITEAGGLVTPLHLDEASPEALELNGYDEERWAREARPWEEVWLEVLGPLWGAVAVGHNLAFDERMIDAMCLRHGFGTIVFSRKIDALQRAKELVWVGLVPSAKLDALVAHFGIEVEGEAHTARCDVLRTIEVYRHLAGLA